MNASPHSTQELSTIYGERFSGREAYRLSVWEILCREFFQQWVPRQGTVLDLGCGYGEFIRKIEAGRKFGMDLNPMSASKLPKDVQLLAQDCSADWQLPDASLDVVFTSNFFEHLPDKPALGRTLDQVQRCLKPGGRLIALGPNIKRLPGAYWDFWDHYLPLTERSLREALEIRGFKVEVCLESFLPYTMSEGVQHPLFLLRAYLRLPIAWRFFGRQFLVVASRTT
jgi:SAM-dependent methyltransferase